MSKLSLIFALITLLPLTGCFINFENIEGPVSLEDARKFSDDLVKDILAEDSQKVLDKMDGSFRKEFSAEEIKQIFDKLNSLYGKPLDIKYKAEEMSQWLYPNGIKKMARIIWYDVRTSKTEMGTCFLYIAVVANDRKTEYAKFNFMDFPNGVPDKLK